MLRLVPGDAISFCISHLFILQNASEPQDSVLLHSTAVFKPFRLVSLARRVWTSF